MAEEETHSMDLNDQHIADVRLDAEGVRRARQAVRRLEATLARELGVSVTILIESLGRSDSDDDADTAGPAAPSADAANAANAANAATNNAANEPNSNLNETRGWSSSPTVIESDHNEAESLESDMETASRDSSGGSEEGGSEEEGDDEDGEEDSEEDSEEEDGSESEGEVANDDASVSSTEEILVQLASGAPVETYFTPYRGPRHPGPTHRAGGYPLRGTESAAPSLGNRGRSSISAHNTRFRAPATRGTSIRGLPRRGGYARGGMSTRPVYGNGLGFPSSSSTSSGTPPPSPVSDWAAELGWPADEPFPADAWAIGKPLQRPDGTWTPPLQFHPPARGDKSVRRFLRFPPTPALPHPLRSEPSAAATRVRARPPPIVTASNPSDTRPSPIEISSDEDKPATTNEVGSQDDIPVADTSRRVIDLTAGDSDDDANSQNAGAVRPQAPLSDACPIEIISDSDESVRARRMSTIDLSDTEEDEVRAALQPPAYTTEDEAGHVEGSDAELSYASGGEKSADM